ncbi:permease [Devosia limi DSM 17137]|uniref:Permease n=1 Tax=Devosia limi DSM 17137 TaxID=1121477 RepID=A0A0F5LWC9_9HYPH|nr:hypothetical protein [Devosia limi]KKB85967.1 permease [Devosia limi DSM 17137]SHF00193.1 ABC-2 type transport system permease protein [Devosia limi DSM 17137]
MSTAPASIAWFARHELNLAWREWLAMMSGGRRTRGMVLLAVLAVVAALLHLLAYGLVAPWVADGITPDKPTLVLLTGGGLLFWSVMLSQALESVTRVYYARSDLDLILSSPASSRRLFAVRTGAVALSTVLLSCLLASPLINMLALLDGPHWLAAYGVLTSVGALSAAIAVAITIVLFRLVGPKRTRLIAQIVAAIVGAGFVIGIQAAAILYYGSYSRFTLLQSAEIVAATPDQQSLLWLPARAAMGAPLALLAVTIIGFGALLLTVAVTASSYGRHAISATGLSHVRTQRRPSSRRFRSASQRHVLRLKEWRLLQRDPWLLSQTLMQILYLLPPALMLWINYGNSAGAFVVVVPVLVMASGQLAGGLAWLAISGEDAHDLVVTAPVSPRSVLIAKIEAVLVIIAAVLAPLLVLIALSSVQMAAITAICAALSAGSATAIQLWFRVVARRSMFRRRQVASRAATLSEAFASIMWAGTGALWAAGSWLALAPALAAVLVLLLARLISPRRR